MALVIVLAFVVLLTGLVVAFLARSVNNEKVATNYSHQTRSDILARSALDYIITDLKQEIHNGSNLVTVGPEDASSTLYLPQTPADAMAQRSGLPADDTIPNLIRRSVRDDTLVVPSRASAINSSEDASIDGRTITPARWNRHYLIPRFDAATNTDTTPDADTGFIAPDWVLLTRNGPAVHTNLGSGPTALNNADKDNSNYVIGRYAYAIYDEGGLLDLNAAGYPEGLLTDVKSRKNNLALADLTRIPIDKTKTTFLSQAQINQFVGWRNYASSQPIGGFGAFTFDAARAKYWHKHFVLENQTGFLKTIAPEDAVPPLTDQALLSRQQLIRLFGSLDISPNALQYFGTFSRTLDQPSFAPDPNRPKVLAAAKGGNSAAGLNADDLINPSFLTTRVGSTFTRNNGETAKSGEPLVKRRFALNRLAWLTYQGPSATRNTSTTTTTGDDADIGLLKQHGISEELLEEGTAENIRKYFGLTWDNTDHCWQYDVHNGSSGAIKKLGDIAQLSPAREPDFFELLKAAMHVGSLGKALLPSGGGSIEPYSYNHYAENSVDLQIIQIGANIISQFQPSNYPPIIIFNDGSGHASMPRKIAGVTNLPYLQNLMTGVLQVRAPNPLPNSMGPGATYPSGTKIIDPGVGALMMLPVVWNPHDPASSTGGIGPTRFRVVADSTTPDLLDSSTRTPYCVYANSGGNWSFDAGNNSPQRDWYADSTRTGAQISRALTADTTAIEFLVQSGGLPLFPEPAMLVRPRTITDPNGNSVQISLGDGHLINTDNVLRDLRVSPGTAISGLPNYFANALNMNQPGQTQDPAGTAYLGFCLGTVPLAWTKGSDESTTAYSAARDGVFWGSVNHPLPTTRGCYMTYRVQYENPFSPGDWITYDTKYGKVMFDRCQFGVGTPSLICGFRGGGQGEGHWATATDPRSSRFGLFWNGTASWAGNYTPVGSIVIPLPIPGPELAISHYGGSSPHAAGWLNPASATLYTIRPDAHAGFGFMKCWLDHATSANENSGWMAWISADGKSFPGIAPGLLSQNNTSAHYVPSAYFGAGQGNDAHAPHYFADPDGMVRRAMGGFVAEGNSTSPGYEGWGNKYPSANTTVGLPMARAFGWDSSTYRPPNPNPTITEHNVATQATSQAQSRPYFLNRPFRNVGELGYVFTDTPWRNIDFSNAESGGVALLDVFCISESENNDGLVAGKINLNTRQIPVLKAVLTEAYLDPALASNGFATSRIDAEHTAGLVSQALVARTSSTASGMGPLRNLSELVGKLGDKTGITHPSVKGVSKVPLSTANGFYDGKHSYSGFSDAGWNNTDQRPRQTDPPTDIYSAYMSSEAFSTNTNNSGTRETLSYIHRFREAPIRALAAAGQTRTWNLMIDVIAQSGRYPKSATSLNQFRAEGEQRYWVHVAIDRLTGEIIDKQIEVVKE